MYLNYSVLSTTNLQITPTPPYYPTTIALSDAIFDEMYTDNILSNNDEFINDGEKRDWSSTTIMKAEFNQNLEAGSFGATDFIVTSIKFKKKKADDSKWITFCEAPYDNSQTLNHFIVYDKITENQVDYDYAICAVCSNIGNIEGHIKYIGSVKSEFTDCYILGADDANYYKLSYNFNQGNIDMVMPNTVINILSGTKYPVVLYNADTQYRKGSIQCYLFADIDGDIDIRQEKTLREQIMNFLCDKKPKIIKAEDGTFMLINIIDTPQLIPNNKRIGLYQLSFKFVECGDIYDEQTLNNYGFIKEVARE